MLQLQYSTSGSGLLRRSGAIVNQWRTGEVLLQGDGAEAVASALSLLLQGRVASWDLYKTPAKKPASRPSAADSDPLSDPSYPDSLAQYPLVTLWTIFCRFSPCISCPDPACAAQMFLLLRCSSDMCSLPELLSGCVGFFPLGSFHVVGLAHMRLLSVPEGPVAPGLSAV